MYLCSIFACVPPTRADTLESLKISGDSSAKSERMGRGGGPLEEQEIINFSSIDLLSCLPCTPKLVPGPTLSCVGGPSLIAGGPLLR
jgi:hypothetical protein